MHEDLRKTSLSTPLETLKNQRFSDIFRGYRKIDQQYQIES